MEDIDMVKTEEVKTEESDSVTGLSCEYCGKEFKRKAYLKGHIKVMHSGMQYCCEQCGKSFKSKVQYVIHHRSHTGERPYKCGKCDKNYKDPSSLNQHVKINHSSISKFKCNMCDRIFQTSKRLSKHIMTHNQNNKSGSKKYTENEKNEAFMLAKDIGVQQAADKLNIRYNTLSNWIVIKENGKLCIDCNRIFSCSSHLIRHRKAMHEGEKRNHSAWKYDKQFREDVRMFATENGVENATEKFSIPESTIRDWISFANNPMMCTFCGKMFRKRSKLKGHLLKKHNSSVSHFSPIELERYVSSFLYSNDIKDTIKNKVNMEQSENREDSKEAININELETKFREIKPTDNQYHGNEHISKLKISQEIEDLKEEDAWIDTFFAGGKQNEAHLILAATENVMVEMHKEEERNGKEIVKMENFNENTEFKSKIEILEETKCISENKMLAFVDTECSSENEILLFEDAECKSENEILEDTKYKSEYESLTNSKTTVNQNAFKIDDYEIVRNSQGLLPCSICNKQFRSPSDVKRHIVTHTGKRNYQCNICFKSFGHANVLKRHMNMHNVKNVQCTKCDKKFTHEKNLELHSQVIHENASVFVCSFCSQSFNRKDHLNRHERIHTGDKPFQCDQCDEKFIEKRVLNTHKYKEHNIPKPHICDMCGKAFELNSGLEKHMPVHSELKQFKCEECEATFQRKRGLIDHRIRHKVEKGEYTGVSSVCCGQIFTSKQRFEIHIQVVHQKQKPFSCDQCNKKFTRVDSLRKHNMIHER